MEELLAYGYWGLFAGSFLAATLVPFSSDILLIGMLAAGGEPLLTVIVATAGNWAGGLTSYWVGWIGRWEWIERWMHVSREKLERQKSRITKYQAWLALLTWLPVVGDLFAVALGFYRIRFVPCALLMLVGKAVRFVMWALIYHGIF